MSGIIKVSVRAASPAAPDLERQLRVLCSLCARRSVRSCSAAASRASAAAPRWDRGFAAALWVSSGGEAFATILVWRTGKRKSRRTGRRLDHLQRRCRNCLRAAARAHGRLERRHPQYPSGRDDERYHDQQRRHCLSGVAGGRLLIISSGQTSIGAYELPGGTETPSGGFASGTILSGGFERVVAGTAIRTIVRAQSAGFVRGVAISTMLFSGGNEQVMSEVSSGP